MSNNNVMDIYKGTPLNEEQARQENLDLDLNFLDNFVQAQIS